MLGRVIVFLLSLVLPGAGVAATVDVDQIYFTGSGGSNGLNGITVQTFTPTITGQLTQLDIQLFASGTGTPPNSGARISIVSATRGLPDITWDRGSQTLTMNTLGAVDLPATTAGLSGFDMISGAFTALDFSAQNVMLQAGSLYTIVMQQTDDLYGTLFWAHDSELLPGNIVQGLYAGGQAGGLQFGGRTPTVSLTDRVDQGFRTHMVPAAIPLPASGLMLLAALATLMLRRRA